MFVDPCRLPRTPPHNDSPEYYLKGPIFTAHRFVFIMAMTDSSSDSSSTTEVAPVPAPRRDAPTVLARFPLPDCTPQRHQEYVEKTADMFYHLMLDYHNEKLACENNGTTWQRDDALHETVYQTQLLTMAFYDGNYRTPALVIETINNFQRGAVVHLAIKNLKDMYPWMTKDSMDQIFTWLFHKHGPWLRKQGFQLSFIEHRLNTRLPTTETAVTQGDEPQ